MVILRVFKILALFLGIITLPLVFLGWPIFISGIFLVFAFVADRFSNPKPGSGIKRSWINFAILLAGGASFYGLYILGSVGHIDTTGKPSGNFILISVAVCIGITSLILWLVNRRRTV